MLTPQTKKRTVIVLVYLLILILVGFSIYLIGRTPASCADKKQNQGEQGVDCGGPCAVCKAEIDLENLVVAEKVVVSGGNDTYDVVAKISNKNESKGAKFFKYTFTLRSSDGTVIGKREGNTFILPADSRYVAELGIQTQDKIPAVIVEVSIDDAQWSELPSVDKPQISVYGKKFGPASSGIGNEAFGIFRNESRYDLAKIFTTVVLRDSYGRIIGVSKNENSAVRAGEEREFHLVWPYELGGDVQSIDVDTQFNAFDLI